MFSECFTDCKIRSYLWQRLVTEEQTLCDFSLFLPSGLPNKSAIKISSQI